MNRNRGLLLILVLVLLSMSGGRRRPPPNGDENGDTNGDTGLDVFGIKEVYPSVSGGPQWDSRHWANGNVRTIRQDTFDTDDPTGWSRSANRDFTINGSGVLRSSGSLRWYINPGSPWWRNTELTFYYRSLTPSDIGITGAYAGVRSSPTQGHGGSYTNFVHTIYGRIAMSGQAMFIKEKWHNDFANNPGGGSLAIPGGINTGQWLGYKYACFDQGADVKLELYVDITEGQNGGNWVKVHEYLDNNSPRWVPTNQQPPKAPAQDERWQLSGFVIVRSDGLTSEYQKMTVREIAA